MLYRSLGRRELAKFETPFPLPGHFRASEYCRLDLVFGSQRWKLAEGQRNVRSECTMAETVRPTKANSTLGSVLSV